MPSAAKAREGWISAGQAARVFWQDVVAVTGNKAVAGEVFAAALHAAPVEPALQRQCQRGNSIGLAMETAIADHGALPPIQIQHRRKRQIHAAGAQFCR